MNTPDPTHPAVAAAELILSVCRHRAAHTDELVEALQRQNLEDAEASRIAASIGFRLQTLHEEPILEQARFFQVLLNESDLERLFGRIPGLGADALQLIREARDRILQR